MTCIMFKTVIATKKAALNSMWYLHTQKAASWTDGVYVCIFKVGILKCITNTDTEYLNIFKLLSQAKIFLSKIRYSLIKFNYWHNLNDLKLRLGQLIQISCSCHNRCNSKERKCK